MPDAIRHISEKRRHYYLLFECGVAKLGMSWYENSGGKFENLVLNANGYLMVTSNWVKFVQFEKM